MSLLISPSRSSYHHINISTYQHINISTYQHINTSRYQHINISTYQHINISTHQHINTSTYQHINISTYQDQKRTFESRHRHLHQYPSLQHYPHAYRPSYSTSHALSRRVYSERERESERRCTREQATTQMNEGVKERVELIIARFPEDIFYSLSLTIICSFPFHQHHINLIQIAREYLVGRWLVRRYLRVG